MIFAPLTHCCRQVGCERGGVTNKEQWGAADAIPTKNHADRIAGLTMVADGLFSLGLDQDGIEIYDQINEILFNLSAEDSHSVLLSALDCLANTLYCFKHRIQLKQILNYKWQRFGELGRPYDFLKYNAAFIAYIDNGKMLENICRELIDVETWWQV